MADSIVQDEPRGVERFIDRYWFLLRGRRTRADAAAGERAGARGTLVLRDGDCVVVSLEASALGWPDGTLLFRLRSETTPCASCVERAITIARHRTDGRLTPSDVREMLRFAVARCAAVAHAPPAQRNTLVPPRPAPDPGELTPPTRRVPGVQGDVRYDAELWLVL